MIHPHLAQFDEIRTRFLQELRANERLTHPGIVRTYTLEQDPNSGFLFFTMEYVEGVTLETLLRQAEDEQRVPPLPLNSMMRLFAELMTILEYAHAQGVIHRDLKPSNIMVTRDGRVKLMDFGIAKVLEGTAVNKHTGFGGFVYYMAPEQLRGGSEVTPAVDVFSLGVISYQLLTGEIPMGAVAPPSRLWPQLTTEIDAIVLRAMDPRPHNRYAHPQDYWHELQFALLPLIDSLDPKYQTRELPEFQLSTRDIDSLSHAHPFGEKETSPEIPRVPKVDAYEAGDELAEVFRSATDLPAVEGPPTMVPGQPTFTGEVKTVHSAPEPEQESQSGELPERLASPNLPVFRSFRASSYSPHPTLSLDKNPIKRISGQIQTLSDPVLSSQMVDLGDEMISLDQVKPKQNKPKKKQEPSSDALLSPSVDGLDLPLMNKPETPLAQELELEIDESLQGRIDAEPVGPTLRDLQRSALDLPPVASHLEEKFFHAKDGTPLFRMTKVPEGTFLMGSRKVDSLAYHNEQPQREVELETYWIARTPLTNRVWLKFIEESGYHCESPDYLQHWRGGRPRLDRLEHPVVYISYEDVQAFCSFYELALPTEAQWEKAARGTEGQIWPWGNQKPHNGLCNFLGSGLHDTTPVASFLGGASPYGLLDCSGNVWEWCADNWSINWLEELGEDAKDPVFSDDSGVYSIRGGCFRYHGRGVRCAFRFNASERTDHLGARVILLKEHASLKDEAPVEEPS
ncbi:MAG: hypothetical protein CL932_07180 [Deltaproteobacteria bacterium]|nr:hypothetical protein [Deltaproteobacteria bacterium]